MVCLSLSAVEVKTVVATVNGKAITKKEVERELKALLPSASYHGGVNEEKKNKLKKDALDNLITKELFYQKALAEKIDVSDLELVEYEKAYIQSFGGRKNFDKTLREAGISLLEFRREIEREKMIQKLYEKRIRYSVSESELKRMYEENRQKYREPEKIKIALIFREVDPKDSKSKAEAKAKIGEAYSKIKSGIPFGDVAYKYSTAMSRVKGGEMGYIHRGILQSAEVEKKVFLMKKGEMSKILESKEGYFIIRFDDKKEAHQYSYDDVKVKMKTELIDERELERKEVMLAELRKNAVIKNSP